MGLNQFLEKVRARIALLPKARAARRLGKRGLLRQLGEILHLRYSSTKLRAKEYYDFELWRRSLSEAREYSGDWHRKWIHQRLNNKAWEVLMTDKAVSTAMWQWLGLPHAEIHAVVDPSRRHCGAVPTLGAADEVARYLRGDATYPFFVKPLKGGEGKGCFSVRRFDAERDALVLGDGTSVSVAEFIGSLEDPTGFGVGFMRCLESHPEIRAICGDAVASIRMVTIREGGSVSLLHADIGVPSGRNMTSNFAKGATGNMLALVDPGSGVVTRLVRGTNGNDLEDIEVHPVSGKRLLGFRFPCFEEAIDVCRRGALALPGTLYHNWDIGITPEGPVILELNPAGDLYAAQYLTNRGFFDARLREFVANHDAPPNDRHAGRPLFSEWSAARGAPAAPGPSR